MGCCRGPDPVRVAGERVTGCGNFHCRDPFSWDSYQATESCMETSVQICPGTWTMAVVLQRMALVSWQYMQNEEGVRMHPAATSA
jgi:hypothetical protein